MAPEQWMTVESAAQALGQSVRHVRARVSWGEIRTNPAGLLHAGDVKEAGEWVGLEAAHQLSGAPQNAINEAAAAGTIGRREIRSRHIPSLHLGDVTRFGKDYRDARRAEREARQAEAEARAARNQPPPPIQGDRWVSTSEAADMLDVTLGRVNQLIHEERLPAARKDGRWWLQANHIQLRLNRLALVAGRDQLLRQTST